jgi:hypothetical protein
MLRSSFVVALLLVTTPSQTLAFPDRLVRTSAMVPNVGASSGLTDLVGLLDSSGLNIAHLVTTMKDNKLHTEGSSEAAGLLLDPRSGEFGLNIPAKQHPLFDFFPYNNVLILEDDAFTHNVHQLEAIHDLRTRLFFDGSLVKGTVNTVIHELLHAMVFRTQCLHGDDEDMVRALADSVTTRLSAYKDLLDNQPSAATRLFSQLVSTVTQDLATHKTWKACYDLLDVAASLRAAPVWTHLTPAIPNGFPVGHLGSQSTAYDAATDRLIVFGGFADPLNPCCGESHDTWVLVNATGTGGTPTWTKLPLKPGSPIPPSRRAHSAVYDAGTKRMIIFGGGQFNGTFFNPLFHDVWVLKNVNDLTGNAEWLELLPTGGPPDSREGHGAVYNPITNEMIILGGGNNGIMSVPGDLWVLMNANQDTGVHWLGPLPQTGDVPGRLEHFAAAYNPGADTLTIAGGCCGYTNATRLLTNASGTSGTPFWTNLTPGGAAPPAGDEADFGYDQGSNRLIVEGPAPGGGTNATWVLTDALGAAPMWINSIPENAPGSPPEVSVIRTGSAYNTAQKKFTLTLNRIVSGTLVPEVWVLSNADQP